MKYFYYYVIEFYDEDNSKAKIDKGFVKEATFAEAVQEIVSYYGENLVNALQIQIIEDKPLTYEKIDEILNTEHRMKPF